MVLTKVPRKRVGGNWARGTESSAHFCDFPVLPVNLRIIPKQSVYLKKKKKKVEGGESTRVMTVILPVMFKEPKDPDAYKYLLKWKY